MTEQDFPDEEYVGPALVSPVVEVRGAPATSLETTEDARASEVSRLAGARTSTTDGGVTVQVALRGRFEPIDGRFHWYGRLAADDALSSWQPGATVLLSTPHGSATGRLSDLDPWGRFRISGTGRPPF